MCVLDSCCHQRPSRTRMASPCGLCYSRGLLSTTNELCSRCSCCERGGLWVLDTQRRCCWAIECVAAVQMRSACSCVCLCCQGRRESRDSFHARDVMIDEPRPAGFLHAIKSWNVDFRRGPVHLAPPDPGFHHPQSLTTAAMGRPRVTTLSALACGWRDVPRTIGQ